MAMTKKEEAQARSDFGLHVLLIRKQLNCPESHARMRAWMEGPTGLAARLAQLQPQLPLPDAPTGKLDQAKAGLK